MKLPGKILVIIALLLTIVLMLKLLGVHGGTVFWNDRATREEQAVHPDLSVFNQAYQTYLARAEEARVEATGDKRLRITELAANRKVLEFYAQEAEAAEQQIVRGVERLSGAINEVSTQVPKKYLDLVTNLRAAVRTRVGDKNRYRADIARLIEEVARARTTYATAHERFLLLEYNQYVLQEELQRRKEMLYRYRWLRPDVQSRVGDNGPFVTAQIISATRYSVVLDKGARHGVELYQKFTISRNGNIVAIINVTEVMNDTCEAEIRELPRQDLGLVPQSGDLATPQRFVVPLGRPDLEARFPPGE